MARFNNVIVDVPKEATVVAGRVYIITESRYFEDRQYNMDSRLTIGWINDSSKKTMNPNSNYVARYPREFNIAAKGKLAPVTKRCGLFIYSLALSYQNGLYPALVDCCGPENANAIMDFANYSILFKSNVAKDYPHLMADQVLYSCNLYSDSWLSELFEKRLTESQQENFKDKWAKACVQRGITKVWLCIDGSNSDCSCKEVELAEKGKAKSRKNCNICSYMYAVDAETGIPITYRLYRGGRVDSKEFIEIQSYLKLYAIEIEGVILDRGFCDIDCLDLIRDQKLKYVIMLKENTYGFHKMFEDHAEEIRMKSNYAVGNGIYATADECRIFGKYNHTSWITLAYDSKNGVERANYLVDKVQRAVQDANTALSLGNKPKIGKDISCYIIPVKESGSIVRYAVNNEKLQTAMDKKGFSALAADSNYGAFETLSKYDLRDKSEKQYMIIKTQLGNRVFRTHFTNGVKSKGFVAFIASIIRNEMERICKETEYELTLALREANFLCVQRTPDNTYMGVHNTNGRQLDLMAAAKLEEKDIDYIALIESNRVNGDMYDQVYKLPSHENSNTDTSGKRKPGRPPGSTKKSANDDDKIKRKRGRPPGSRNKPKQSDQIIKTSETPCEQNREVPRKRGRPPGSKNKKPAVNARAKRNASKVANESAQ
ncbi:MAG: transposase [Blautia sp.]|nr:transposase [Blautia sp.]